MIPKYFEDIKDVHLCKFLKQNNIYWNRIASTNLSTLIKPENVERIAKNSKTHELFLRYKGLSDFFCYSIDENLFVLINQPNDICINLSEKWQLFLEEFKKENTIEGTSNF